MRLVLGKMDLDKARKDKQHEVFPEHMQVELIFEEVQVIRSFDVNLLFISHIFQLFVFISRGTPLVTFCRKNKKYATLVNK